MREEGILEPKQLRRYADAIVKASLGVTEGETLVGSCRRSRASGSSPRTSSRSAA